MRTVKCEFSVEAAYVMAIVIFTLAFLIKQAYSMRDEVVGNYITGEAALEAVHSEETWLMADGVEAAENIAASQLKAISRLRNRCIAVERREGLLFHMTEDDVFASFDLKDKNIEIKVRDPENYMRATTLFEKEKENE